MATIEPITGRYVHVPYQGVDYRMFYEEAGEGIPMVCLHTAGTDSREWRHQLCDPDINKHFRVIALDLPRHGKSIPPGDWYLETEEYKLTAEFYSGIVMALLRGARARPAGHHGQLDGRATSASTWRSTTKRQLRSLIAIEACDHSPGWHLDWLHNSQVHGGEACATSVFGLMAPQSPDEYRWETWWYYAQGGPGVFKGDLYFYSVDHDFRDLCSKLSGNIPIYLMTGVYDFACTPEMTEETAKKVKGSECIIMQEIGHFPMCENPEVFKKYLMPVLDKIRAQG